MAKGGGSLGRGRKTREETADIPVADQLAAADRRVQAILQELVERAGGRWGLSGSRSIPVGAVGELADFGGAWMLRHSRPGGKDDRLYYSGRPGFWRAFDELYPLQDPNRWNPLRHAVMAELEERGYERQGGPNGSSWYLPSTA